MIIITGKIKVYPKKARDKVESDIIYKKILFNIPK